MDVHYAGYFNPATATIPIAPLLVALLLGAAVWVILAALRIQRRLITRALWISYCLYALVVVEEYAHLLEWRWAARQPDAYPVAEGPATKIDPLPGHCDGPCRSTQSFKVGGMTFIAGHDIHRGA